MRTLGIKGRDVVGFGGSIGPRFSDRFDSKCTSMVREFCTTVCTV